MGNDRPDITVIVPTYRRPKLLRRAIKSVLSQTYESLQVCVFDNASGDETGQVVAELAREDDRVKYFCNTANLGMIGNFNRGLSMVDTDYFSLLCDDDIILPGFLEAAMEGFGKYRDAGFFAGSTIMAGMNGKVLGVPLDSWPREGYFPAPQGLFEMTGGLHPILTGMLFRSEVLDNFSAMDAEVGMPSDLDFELKVAARYPIIVSKKPCAIFNINTSSTGGTADYHYMWPGWLKMIKNLKDDPEIPDEAKARVERELSLELRRNLLYHGYKSITVRNYDHGYEISKILREHFNLRLRPEFISAGCTICKNFPQVYYAMDPLNHIRKTIPRKGRIDLQNKYADYLKYLDS